jgi:DNA mismatch repair protein MutS2
MYPHNLEQIIGFDQIRQLLTGLCNSIQGRERADSVKIETHFNPIATALNENAEFKAIIQQALSFPDHHFPDTREMLTKLKIDGLFLTLNELHQVRTLCVQIQEIQVFLKKNEQLFPALNAITKDLEPIKQVPAIINKVVDELGHIKPNASPQLAAIEKDIRVLEGSIHQKLKSIFTKAKNEGWTSDTDISVREGRLVIPVIAEHKRKIRGLVHDESASGSVLYIEPTEIVEANNKLRHLYFSRNREIEKILKETTAQLIPYQFTLELYHDTSAKLDFIGARARLSIKLNAAKPILGKKGAFHLINAFHPLLYLKLKRENLTPVPVEIQFTTDNRIMVISGPNAGGKSVALKTIALNQYMLQCGLDVCASPDSSFCIFKNMMVDIGDGQSIDNNLSSYSAHLNAMKYFVNHSNKDSIFFIDELGSGTDPLFGGAIGQAVLERLNLNNAYGVVTTHFSNIKNYASSEPGFMNGSMLYDMQKYMPLYKLSSGKPGSSYALELAKKTGLNKDIIEKAKSLAGKEHHQMDEMLANYEQDIQKHKLTEKRLLEKEKTLNKLIADYEYLKTGIAERKAEIIQSARSEAAAKLDNTNRLIEQTIREIKTSKADPIKTKALRKKLDDEKQLLKTEIQKQDPKPNPVPHTEKSVQFEPGQLVKIKKYDTVGTILEVGKNRILVETGLVKSRMEFDQVEIMAPQTHKKPSVKIRGFNYSDISREFTQRIDVRGMNAEDALKTTMDAVDNALVLSVDKLWILHGKGDGVLRKLLRENLRKVSHVKQLESEHPDFGGDGITIITLG